MHMHMHDSEDPPSLSLTAKVTLVGNVRMRSCSRHVLPQHAMRLASLRQLCSLPFSASVFVSQYQFPSSRPLHPRLVNLLHGVGRAPWRRLRLARCKRRTFRHLPHGISLSLLPLLFVFSSSLGQVSTLDTLSNKAGQLHLNEKGFIVIRFLHGLRTEQSDTRTRTRCESERASE